MGGEGHLGEEGRRSMKDRQGTLLEPDRAQLRRLFAEATRGEADLLVCKEAGA